MWEGHIIWAILVAVLLKLVSSHIDTLPHYAAYGIIVALLLMFHKCRQSIVEAQVARPSLEIQRTIRTARRSSSIVAAGPPHFNSFFPHAHNFVINNPIMANYQREDPTRRIMELLSTHILFGVAHNDSARAPPPRCLRGMRIRILKRLEDWLYEINRPKSLFLLGGPAGVGKSAIIQTFAESVKHAIASIFISRLNKRNDPNRIFTTITYQFATRIEAYREYIVGRLTVDPSLLSKDMQTQFENFIKEPFVKRKIGAGGPPVAILLDELDEVEGVNAQGEIIRLISAFTRRNKDTPLVWIIASRPEVHISNTFDQFARYDAETISINSEASCNDVRRFLCDGFDIMRRDFPSTTLPNWPEETAPAGLADASAGLFIFADTAIRFIRDPDHANPISRLQRVLSVIDRSESVSIGENPFKHLDNLYMLILSEIPTELWPTMKRFIRLALSFHNDNFLGLSCQAKTRTLRGMTNILSQSPEGQQETIWEFWKRSPYLPVLVCGTLPGGRVALCKGNDEGTKYCIIPERQ